MDAGTLGMAGGGIGDSRAHFEGGVEVSAIDPVASMQAIENAELTAVAGEVRDLLAKAVEAI